MTQCVDLKIRLATADDVHDITKLHLACLGPDDHVAVILGRRYVEAIYRWQVSGKEAYTVVAESGGRVVSFGGVCERAYTGPMFRACLRPLLVSMARNPSLLLDRRLWRRLNHRSEVDARTREVINRPGVAHLMTGATDAGYRGRGVNGAVVQALQSIVRSRGSKALCVAMRRTNHASQRVFIKLGWHELPGPEAAATVYYLTCWDRGFADKLGVEAADQSASVSPAIRPDGALEYRRPGLPCSRLIPAVAAVAVRARIVSTAKWGQPSHRSVRSALAST